MKVIVDISQWVLTHSLTHSLAHSLTHSYSLTHSLTHSLTRSLTHSLTYLPTYSLTHSLALGGQDISAICVANRGKPGRRDPFWHEFIDKKMDGIEPNREASVENEVFCK